MDIRPRMIYSSYIGLGLMDSECHLSKTPHIDMVKATNELIRECDEPKVQRKTHTILIEDGDNDYIFQCDVIPGILHSHLLGCWYKVDWDGALMFNNVLVSSNEPENLNDSEWGYTEMEVLDNEYRVEALRYHEMLLVWLDNANTIIDKAIGSDNLNDCLYIIQTELLGQEYGDVASHFFDEPTVWGEDYGETLYKEGDEEYRVETMRSYIAYEQNWIER